MKVLPGVIQSPTARTLTFGTEIGGWKEETEHKEGGNQHRHITPPQPGRAHTQTHTQTHTHTHTHTQERSGLQYRKREKNFPPETETRSANMLENAVEEAEAVELRVLSGNRRLDDLPVSVNKPGLTEQAGPSVPFKNKREAT